MRGGYIHNQVLIAPIARRVSELLDVRASQEVPIWVKRRRLYGDLIIESRSMCILVEAELTARRLESDVEKALAIDADELWIVVPNPSVRKSILRRLSNRSSHRVKLFVFSVPQALHRLAKIFELISGTNCGSGSEKQFIERKRL